MTLWWLAGGDPEAVGHTAKSRYLQALGRLFTDLANTPSPGECDIQ